MAHKGFVDYPRSTQETASNTWQGPRSSLLSPRAVAGFTVAQFPSWDHDWVGPARRRTRRFITDFYSDTDGFVIGRRDYTRRAQDSNSRTRGSRAIPRAIEFPWVRREEGHAICHRGRSVIRGQSSLVTASRRVRYCYCDNVLSCVSGSKSGRWLLIGEAIVDPESNKAATGRISRQAARKVRAFSEREKRSPVYRETSRVLSWSVRGGLRATMRQQPVDVSPRCRCWDTRPGRPARACLRHRVHIGTDRRYEYEIHNW